MAKKKPEYVRFARRAGSALAELPSHEGMRRGPVKTPGVRRRRRLPVRLATLLVLPLAVLAGAVILALQSGLVAERLQPVARQTLLAMVPPDLVAELGETDVQLAWPPALAITYQDLALRPAEGGAPLAHAASLSVAIDPASLASGTPRVSGLSVSGLQVDLPALLARQPASGPVRMDLSEVPDRFDALFAALRRWGSIHLLREGGVRLAVSESTIRLRANAPGETLVVTELTGTASEGKAALSLDGFLGSLPVSVETRLALDPADPANGVASLEMDAEGLPFPWRRLPTLFSNVPEDHEPDADPAPVPTRLTVSMADGGPAEADDRLRIVLEPLGLALKLDEGDAVPLSGRLAFSYGFDDSVVTLERSAWRLGSAEAEVSARLRDAPGEAPADVAAGALPVPLEFDAIINRGRIAPSDSPEAPVRFAARAQGIFYPVRQRLVFSDMQLASEAGDAVAEGEMVLGGEAPTAVFTVDVSEMAVAGVKQFWPAPVARAARKWVLDNLAGGRVTRGRFDIAEPLRRRIEGTDQRLTGDTRVALEVEGVRFDIAGDIPPVRDATGAVQHADNLTTITLREGTVFMPSGRTATARDGTLVFTPSTTDQSVNADVSVSVTGSAAAIGELISFQPIDAKRFRAYEEADLAGAVDAKVGLTFKLNDAAGIRPEWAVALSIRDGASRAPIDGRVLAGLDGTIDVTPQRAVMDLDGTIDGLPAAIAMTVPFEGSGIAPSRDITLKLDDKQREKLAPGLSVLLTGTTPVRVEGDGDPVSITADLDAATLALPWIGWTKGKGVSADAVFDLVTRGNATVIDNFRLSGDGFRASGRIDVSAGGLSRAQFSQLRLNPGDEVAVDIRREGKGYAVTVEGAALDARALMRHVRRTMNDSGAGDAVPVNVNAAIGRVKGFRGEELRNVRARLTVAGGGVESLSITGNGASGMPFSLALSGQGANRKIRLEALDAGEFLRFADIYGQVRGGILNMSLAASDQRTLAGQIQLRDFRVFNEPKLAQLVSSKAGNSGSLRDAVKRDIDTREVVFDIASGDVSFGRGTLDLARGIVRGPLVGFALQGRVFDQDNRMRMTGTFLPAYGLNSLFADIPLLGLVLGNGRDRGLIGVTFKLEGPFDNPSAVVNPLSVIAPGVFRSIFEFR